MTRGPYHARAAVWSLEGWLVILRSRLPQSAEVTRILERLMEESPNTRRLMRKLTYEIHLHDRNGDEKKAVEKTGILMGLNNSLKTERLFNELVLFPDENIDRMDSPVDLKRTLYTQNHSRGEEKNLDFFCVRHGSLTIKPPPRNWKRFPGNISRISPVRSLVSIDEHLLAIVANRQIGIAEKEGKEVVWYDEKPEPLWSAAFYPGDDKRAGLLAVAGEWHPGYPKEVIHAYRLDNGGKLHPINGFFPAWKNWNERIRFTGLAWDAQGGLWAITGGKGDLFYWPNAAKMDAAKPAKPEPMASTGSSQHSLSVLDDLVICGGWDGVLRAFNFQGRLVWANVLPGTIRAISKISPSFMPVDRFSDLAVITEKEYLILFDRKGKQEGLLHIPARFLLSMSSGPLKKEEPRHHLIGTLRGEIRIVEEVPKKWPGENYLLPEKKTGEQKRDAEMDVVLRNERDAIQKTIERYTNKIIENSELCGKWCEARYAVNEPFRAAWAVSRLIRPSHREYGTVLLMLRETRGWSDHSTQELQVHVFAHLGKRLHEIPLKHHEEVQALCANISGKALASLLLNIPARVQIALLLKNYYSIRRNILRGCPFVSSAVLQRLRGLPKSSSRILDFFVLDMLRKFRVHSNTMRSGFIEGLLAILFQRLDMADGRFLFALSRMPSCLPKLASTLLMHPGQRKIFCYWLELYGSVVLPAGNLRLWATLSPELRKSVSDIPAALVQMAKRLTKQETLEGVPDVLALKNFAVLFPQEDPLSDPHQMPEGWKQCRDRTRMFCKRIDHINQYVSSAWEMQQWLEETRRALERFTPKIPLVSNIEDAWRQAWLKELERLRQRVFLWDDIATEPVERFFRAIGDIGFTDGCFYGITEVPGCDGILKLIHTENRLEGDLPVSRPLDGILACRINEYTQDSEPDNEKLVFSVYTDKKGEPQDEGTEFWRRLLHLKNTRTWLEVPVLRKTPQGNYQPIALFTFEWSGNYEKSSGESLRSAVFLQVSLKKKMLRRILDGVHQILVSEEREKEQQWQQYLVALDQRLFREVDRSAIEKALLETAVEITKASGGLLLTPEGVRERLLIRSTAGTPQHCYQDISFDLIDDDHHPIVYCWQSGEPLYLPNWYESNFRPEILAKLKREKFSRKGCADAVEEWLKNGIKSLVAMIIWSGDKRVGAISLESPIPYSFDAGRIRALQGLLQRVRWFLYAVDLDHQRRNWEYAFVHEMRSDLIPVVQGIDKIRRVLREPPAPVEKNLARANQHCRRLLNLSENFMDAQRSSIPRPNIALSFSDIFSILDELLSLYKEAIERMEQRITLPPESDTGVWQHSLAGDEAVFARIVRNLLDNALKYGERGAVIHIDAEIISEMMWQLTISNPGWMTQEEDALKFHPYEKPNRVRHAGSHVGLAASRIWVDAYGGELKLENKEEENGEKRVYALLRWPLAKRKEELS
ncbi:MAG: GAF domain-containing sensor histidine kinase, partial [Gammaproteobacteria bacterium]|nr:GAF domain-containing sensor histidine kinase [Gammaproteobacteria bacterium]